MIALIRNHEVIKETEFTDWIKKNIEWMTSPKPIGDGWQLVTDYQESNTIE